MRVTYFDVAFSHAGPTEGKHFLEDLILPQECGYQVKSGDTVPLDEPS
jgi:hypothetical protein